MEKNLEEAIEKQLRKKVDELSVGKFKIFAFIIASFIFWWSLSYLAFNLSPSFDGNITSSKFFGIFVAFMVFIVSVWMPFVSFTAAESFGYQYVPISNLDKKYCHQVVDLCKESEEVKSFRNKVVSQRELIVSDLYLMVQIKNYYKDRDICQKAHGLAS